MKTIKVTVGCLQAGDILDTGQTILEIYPEPPFIVASLSDLTTRAWLLSQTATIYEH